MPEVAAGAGALGAAALSGLEVPEAQPADCTVGSSLQAPVLGILRIWGSVTPLHLNQATWLAVLLLRGASG